MCALLNFEGLLSNPHPQKYTPELRQGHLWAFQSLLSTNPNWSHALLVPNMRWRTGGRWLPHCLRSKVPLLKASHFLHTHTPTHANTRSTYGMPTHLLPLFSSPFLYALISGCANPLAKSGTLLPIWPSMTPAERDGGKNEGSDGEGL